MKAAETGALAASLAAAVQRQQAEQLHALLKKLRRYQSKRLELERRIARQENGFFGSFAQASDYCLARIYDKIKRIDAELDETSQARQDSMITRLEELHAQYRQLTGDQDLYVALSEKCGVYALPCYLQGADLFDRRLATENRELQRRYSAILAENRQKYGMLARNSAKLRVYLLKVQDLSRVVEQDDHQLQIAEKLLEKYERNAHSLAGSLHGVEHLGQMLGALKDAAAQLEANLRYLDGDFATVKELASGAERLIMSGYCLEQKYIAHYKKIRKVLSETQAKQAKPQLYQLQAAISQFSRYKDGVLQAQLGLLALVKRCNNFASFCREQEKTEAVALLSEKITRLHAYLSQEMDSAEARVSLSRLSAVASRLDKLG